MLGYPTKQQQKVISNAKRRFARKDIKKEIEKEQQLRNKYMNDKIEELIKKLDKIDELSLRYKIIDKFFPQIPKDEIKEYKVFLPISMKTNNIIDKDVFFTSDIDIPTIWKEESFSPFKEYQNDNKK